MISMQLTTVADLSIFVDISVFDEAFDFLIWCITAYNGDNIFHLTDG